MPTITEWLPLGTAFVLGMLHALEVDHMIAVTAFVATRPALRVAGAFGLRWGLGHSLAVLVAGGVLLASGLRWAGSHEHWGEALVGVLLIGVGIWAIRTGRQLHLHPPQEHGDHAHLHAHPPSSSSHRHSHPSLSKQHQHHRHAISLVGVAHGLAGTTTVVALLPVTLVDRVAVGVAYLLAFGAGTVVAMTIFAVVVASAMQAAGSHSPALGRHLSTGAGLAGIAVGLWWVARSLPSG
ncbi:MAG: hypothetical protein SGI84_02195 [Gemmatimonadota bacterium]|nr:hypothetical protein [Gemmatimonadota bacterium]